MPSTVPSIVTSTVPSTVPSTVHLEPSGCFIILYKIRYYIQLNQPFPLSRKSVTKPQGGHKKIAGFPSKIWYLYNNIYIIYIKEKRLLTRAFFLYTYIFFYKVFIFFIFFIRVFIFSFFYKFLFFNIFLKVVFS